MYNILYAGVTFKLLLTHGGGFSDERNLKIGRTPPLSRDKYAMHFPQVQCHVPGKWLSCPSNTHPKTEYLQLREETGIPYNEMLYFDDCFWTDHCDSVAKNVQEWLLCARQ